MEDKLLELLKCDAQEITLSFKKASIEGAGTPQEVADRREGAIVQCFLRKYFPFPYRIVKGNIIDSNGTASNSIDCLILSPSHPFTIDPKNEKASIIFADGVDIAIEVKPDLSREKELFRALIQIQSVKKLRRKRSGFYKANETKEEIDVLSRIPTFIFANKTYSDVRMLIQIIVNFYITHNVPLSEQFDFIVVNDRMILFNAYKPNYTQIGSNHGILFAETKENTLAVFLLWLNKVPKSEMSIGKTVLEFCLDDSLFNARLQTFHDLNALKKTHDNSMQPLPPNVAPEE